MEERYTLSEVRGMIGNAYNNLNYNRFVEEILQTSPREPDVWQEEKWELFQAMCIGLLRFPEKYLANVMHSNSP